MKNSILTLGKTLNKVEQQTIQGGTSRRKYCKTLKKLLLGGGFQGDYNDGHDAYNKHCN